MKITNALRRNCPNPSCLSSMPSVAPRVILHSKLRTKAGPRRRYRCKLCHLTFAATTGTVYSRMRRQKSDFDRATQLQSEGMCKASTARDAITRWLQKAGQRAVDFHAPHASLKEAVEGQLDELSCKGTGEAKNAWAFSGVEVWSRIGRP